MSFVLGVGEVIQRAIGLDVDQAVHRIGAVDEGAGASNNFDALDLAEGNRNVLPEDPAKELVVNLTPIHESLHTLR